MERKWLSFFFFFFPSSKESGLEYVTDWGRSMRQSESLLRFFFFFFFFSKDPPESPANPTIPSQFQPKRALMRLESLSLIVSNRKVLNIGLDYKALPKSTVITPYYIV
jgi:hypothetical protein